MTIVRINQKGSSKKPHTYAPPQANAQMRSHKMSVMIVTIDASEVLHDWTRSSSLTWVIFIYLSLCNKPS